MDLFGNPLTYVTALCRYLAKIVFLLLLTPFLPTEILPCLKKYVC